MLSMPSVSTTQSVVSRPLLASDTALRVPNAPRAIAPTTAVSKERSTVEARVPEGMTRAAPQASASAAPAPAVAAVPARQSTAPRVTAPAETTQQPPGERSAVQKAMDTQIKDLFSSVWKASAKAVDFLLSRPEPTAGQVAAASEPMSAIIWSLTAPAGSRFSQAELASAAPEVPRSAPEVPPAVYSSRGTASGQTAASRGGLLDVLA